MSYIPPAHGSLPEWQRIVANAFNSGGQKKLNAVAVSAAHTVADGDDVILCDASGGAFTVTLPTAERAISRAVTVKKVDASANAVTLDADDTEEIDGATTQSIGIQYESLTVFSDGTEWHIL